MPAFLLAPMIKRLVELLWVGGCIKAKCHCVVGGGGIQVGNSMQFLVMGHGSSGVLQIWQNSGDGIREVWADCSDCVHC